MGPVHYEFSETAHTFGCSACAPAIVPQVLLTTLTELTLTGRVLPAQSLRLAHELHMVLPVFRGDPLCIWSSFCTMATVCPQLPFHIYQRLTVLYLVSTGKRLQIQSVFQASSEL